MLPSVWNINAGCDSKLELFPFDLDNNTINCQWTSDINSDQGILPNKAFRLNRSECIIYYHADEDEWTSDKSIIDLIIQDFEGPTTDSTRLSEIPVQFTTNRIHAKIKRESAVTDSSLCQSIPTIESITLHSKAAGEFCVFNIFISHFKELFGSTYKHKLVNGFEKSIDVFPGSSGMLREYITSRPAFGFS